MKDVPRIVIKSGVRWTWFDPLRFHVISYLMVMSLTYMSRLFPVLCSYEGNAFTIVHHTDNGSDKWPRHCKGRCTNFSFRNNFVCS